MAIYDFKAMSARQDRATDRDRARVKKQLPENRKKYRFRRKKGSKSKIPSRAQAFSIVEDARLVQTRGRPQTIGQAVGVVGQALQSIITNPAEAAAATAVPMGGIMGRTAAAGIAAIPGIGRYLGRNVPPGALGRVMRVGGAAALGAAAGEGVDFLQRIQRGAGEGEIYSPASFPRALAAPQSNAMMPYGTGGGPVMQQTPLGTLSRGQEFPGGPFVVKTWDTYPGPGVTGGGAWPIFALLSDGRIVVSKPDGSWKVYRPKKNLVISSNPRLRDIRKLDRMHKKVTKMIKRMVPAPRRK